MPHDADSGAGAAPPHPGVGCDPARLRRRGAEGGRAGSCGRGVRRDRLGRPRRSPGAEEGGQASAELIAVVPLAVVAVLAVAHLVVAGWALWSAGAAARAGARAEHVGGDPRAAARSALPEPLRSGARVDATGGPVEVAVDAPALLSGLPALELSAAARLDPAPGDG